VAERSGFRSDVVKGFGNHEQRIVALEKAVVSLIERVDRGFWGRLKALVLGR